MEGRDKGIAKSTDRGLDCGHNIFLKVVEEIS